MKVDEIVNIINTSKDAVDRCAFGPLFAHPDQSDIMNKQVNQIAFGIFMAVLNMRMNEALSEFRLKYAQGLQKPK